MAQPRATAVPMGFDDYLSWEVTQERKHEFVDGFPVAMAGANEAHNLIQTNLLAAAHGRLRGGPCRPFSSDMKVRTGTGNGRYPDMTADCGRRNAANLIAPEPRAVFEVLSPETQRDDRTVKLADYNSTPSIAHYVLIEPTEPLVHVYSRGPHGDFNLRPDEIRGLEASVALPAVALTLPMATIYEGLSFT